MSDQKQIETELKSQDLRDEEWREYEFGGQKYRIYNPQTLFTRPGGTTHRVLDLEGIVHCVPTVGERGCILRWKPRDVAKAVAF